MALTLGGIIIDRVQQAIAEDLESTQVLYRLTQLTDVSIDISSETKDATDAQGVLVKRFYTNKTGTFTANNAFLDLNVLAAKSGKEVEIASSSAKIKMPFIETIAKDKTELSVAGLVPSSAKVIGVASNGAKVKTYTKGTAADADKFVEVEASEGTPAKITLPTDSSNADVAKYVVVGQREVVEGYKVTNEADAFPTNIKLTIKALAVDECHPDTVRSVYVVFPNFMPSPDMSIGLATDSTLEYNGDIMTSYCDEGGKVLYDIYYADEISAD